MIAFPTPGPDDIVTAQLRAGLGLERRPSWDLQTVRSCPYRSSPEYEPFVRNSVGSSYDSGDELLFDAASGLLRSFILKVPEVGSIDPVLVRAWLAVPRTLGLPAISRDTGFVIDPLDVRSLSADGQHLLVLGATPPEPSGGALRVAVHPDFDMLFSNGKYCGWVLHEPIAHLAPVKNEDGPRSPEDSELVELLRDYLALVIEPNVNRMQDHDPSIRTALEALLERARACRAPGPAAEAIAVRVAELLDWFFE